MQLKTALLLYATGERKQSHAAFARVLGKGRLLHLYYNESHTSAVLEVLIKERTPESRKLIEGMFANPPLLEMDWTRCFPAAKTFDPPQPGSSSFSSWPSSTRGSGIIADSQGRLPQAHRVAGPSRRAGRAHPVRLSLNMGSKNGALSDTGSGGLPSFIGWFWLCGPVPEKLPEPFLLHKRKLVLMPHAEISFRAMLFQQPRTRNRWRLHGALSATTKVRNGRATGLGRPKILPGGMPAAFWAGMVGTSTSAAPAPPADHPPNLPAHVRSFGEGKSR